MALLLQKGCTMLAVVLVIVASDLRVRTIKVCSVVFGVTLNLATNIHRCMALGRPSSVINKLCR